MNRGVRGLCLNCMDGRVQLPVLKWIHENNDVECVDMITEAGMDGFVSDPNQSIQDILRQIQISRGINNAKKIFVVAHHDCRGNPASDETHKKQVVKAVERLKDHLGQDLDIQPLWVNSAWECEAL